jgi:hypothetical protein
MKWEDVKVGKVYGSYDDASYLVTYKTDEWICLLQHSHNHKIVSPIIWSKNEDYIWIERWNEYEDYYIDEIFNNLEYINSDTLKEKD